MNNLNNNLISKNKNGSDLLIGFLIIIIIAVFVFAVNIVNCKNNNDDDNNDDNDNFTVKVKENFSDILVSYSDNELEKLLSNKNDILKAKRILGILNSNDFNINQLDVSDSNYDNNKFNLIIRIIKSIISNYLRKAVQDNNVELYYLIKSFINEKLDKLDVTFNDLYQYAIDNDKDTISVDDIKIPMLMFNNQNFDNQIQILKSKLIMNKNNLLQQDRQDKDITKMMITMNDINNLMKTYRSL